MKTSYKWALFLGVLALTQHLQPGRSGWGDGLSQAHAQQPRKGARAEVTASQLWLNRGPGKYRGRMRLLSRGTRLEVLGSSSGWTRVRTASGTIGWVSAKYLKVLPEPRSVPNPVDDTDSQFRKIVVKRKEVQYRGREIRVRTYNVTGATARYRVYYDFRRDEFQQKVGSVRVSRDIALAVQIVETNRFLVCDRGFKKAAILHTGRILRKLALNAGGAHRHAVHIVRTVTLQPEWLDYRGQTVTATVPTKGGGRTRVVTRYRFDKGEMQRALGGIPGDTFKLKLKLYKSNADYACRGNAGTIKELHLAHVVLTDPPGHRIKVVAPTAPAIPWPTTPSVQPPRRQGSEGTRWPGFKAKIIGVKRSGRNFDVTIDAGYRSGVFDFNEIYLLAGDKNRTFKLWDGKDYRSVNWHCTEFHANRCTGRVRVRKDVFANNRRVGILRKTPALSRLRRGHIYQYLLNNSSPEIRIDRGKDYGLHSGSLIYLLEDGGRAFHMENGRPVVFHLSEVLNTKSRSRSSFIDSDLLKENGPVAFRGHPRRRLPEGPDFSEPIARTQPPPPAKKRPARSRPPKECFGAVVRKSQGEALIGRVKSAYFNRSNSLRKDTWVSVYGQTDKHYYVRDPRRWYWCVRKQDLETQLLERMGGLVGTVVDTTEAAWDGVKTMASCVRKGALGCVVKLLLQAIDAGCGALATAVTKVAQFFRGPYNTLLGLVSPRLRALVEARDRCAGQFARGAFCGMLDTIKTAKELAIGVAKEIIAHPKTCLMAGITTVGGGTIACGLIYYMEKAVKTVVHTFQCLAKRGELLKTLVGAVFESGCYVAGSEFRNWALAALTGGSTLPITLTGTLKLVLKKIGKGLLKAHKTVSFAHALNISSTSAEVALETIIGTAERTLHAGHRACR